MFNISGNFRKVLFKIIKYFLIIAAIAVIIIVIASMVVGIKQAKAPLASAPAHEVLADKVDVKKYARPEEGTYLTLPEWFIVYSAKDYAVFLEKNKMDKFPFFKEMSYFWTTYYTAYKVSKAHYSFNFFGHLKIVMTGIGFSVEYAIKFLYENSIGRLTSALADDRVEEEDVSFTVASDYAKFVTEHPWYEFSFSDGLGKLKSVGWVGNNQIRKVERRLMLMAEYGFKAIYASAVSYTFSKIFGVAEPITYAKSNKIDKGLLSSLSFLKIIKEEDKNDIISLPRYQPFTDAVSQLVTKGVVFDNIAGNKHILATARIPVGSNLVAQNSIIAFKLAIPTDLKQERVGFIVKVNELSGFLSSLQKNAIPLEHIYDY